METRTHRAALGAYATAAAATWSLGAGWLVVVARMHAPWQPVLVPLAGFVCALVWLSRFRVQVDEGGIEFAEPFRRTRRCKMDDIVSIEPDEGAGRVNGVCIRMSSGEVLRRSFRLFPPEAVRQLLALAPDGRRAA